MIQKNIRKIVNQLKDKLDREDIENIIEFIEVNESGLAFEILCTQIYEYSIEIDTDTYTIIRVCAADLNTPESYTSPLQELLK